MRSEARGKRGLSASALKAIALISMVLDHLLKTKLRGAPAALYPLGRIAFPLYAFLLAQGAYHTRSMGRYALRLFAFALLSEVPYDLCFFAAPFAWGAQNVYWTLLLALLALWAYGKAERQGRQWMGAAAMVVALWAADGLHCDYGSRGVGCILMMYFAGRAEHRGLRLTLCGLGIAWTCLPILFGRSAMQLAAFAALLPIGLYGGKRGRQGHWAAWYAAYPLHLLALWLP